jgi:cell division protein FtsA
MFERPSIVVGLEIGTAKVCAMVGEVTARGALSIIGVGQARSRGVRKGEIVDARQASEDIRTAIAEAEEMADQEIRRVYLGVSGGHLRSFNNRGVHPVASVDRLITQEDVQDVVKNAKALSLPPENHVVHVVRQHFQVDDQLGVHDPVGMCGARLQVDVHVVHGKFHRLQNSIGVVKSLQLDVADIVFNGMASTLAVLTPEHKELGALVIDLGAGVTEYTVCADGIIKHTGVLAVGGDHVTNDLACGLKVSLGRAEQLKLEHGHALVEDQVLGKTLSLPNEMGLPEKTINLEHLRRIMSLRLEEIFQIIAEDLTQAGQWDYLGAGVFLCGGGARVPEIETLAKKVFRLPVHRARNHSVSGLKSALDQPEFATVIGLLRFGAAQHRRRMASGGLRLGLRQTLQQWFRRS